MDSTTKDEKRVQVWIAVKHSPVWSENEQFDYSGTWDYILGVARHLVRTHNREVRISTSEGFNNQGRYLHPADLK